MEKITKAYINGVIITLDDQNRIVEAMSLAGDKIARLGSNEVIKQDLDSDVEVVDLEGKTMLPGFYDCHSHIVLAGQNYLFKANLSCAPIGNKVTIADCLEVLRQQAETTPADYPIYGFSYDDTLIAEKRHLTKEDLDLVSTTRPVIAIHISTHLAYVNSKALEMLDYHHGTPNPAGGVIEKDPDTGEPTGVLKEKAMMVPLVMTVDFLPQAKKIEALQQVGLMYAQAGVTTATDGMVMTMENIELAQVAAASGKLPIRLIMHPLLELADEAKNMDSQQGMVKIGAIKDMQDGSIQGYTACLSKPFHTAFMGDVSYCGHALHSREELTQRLLACYQKGEQVLVHCCGDGALDDYLSALEVAQATYPQEDGRPIILHGLMVRDDQMEKIKALKGVISFFNVHTYYWGDRHVQTFLGPERGSMISPIQMAKQYGIPFSLHCDTPVTPQKPLFAIWCAVTRASATREIIGQEQCIGRLDALRAYTINAAYQNFEENEKGTLAQGKLADLVILADNPLTCPLEELADIRVLETIVGGQTVFKV